MGWSIKIFLLSTIYFHFLKLQPVFLRKNNKEKNFIYLTAFQIEQYGQNIFWKNFRFLRFFVHQHRHWLAGFIIIQWFKNSAFYMKLNRIQQVLLFIGINYTNCWTGFIIIQRIKNSTLNVKINWIQVFCCCCCFLSV